MALRERRTRYDDETGERFADTDRPAYDRKHWPGYWWRMELATAGLILDNEMTFTDVKVFMALVEKLGENNLAIVAQTTIAKRLKTSRSAVSRSVAHLVQLGFVEKVESNVYKLDVELGWNGGEVARWEEKKTKAERSKLKAVEQ